LVYALAAVFLVLAWQSLTVHINYGGNWTALFCSGDRWPPPAELSGTYVFPNSTGYDGQFYRYVAHDPWIRKGWDGHFDVPAMRRARILLPATAWLLAFGQDRLVDAAYISAVLLCVFLGTWWLGCWAKLQHRSEAWGLAFLALPATLISIDRMTIDVALTALCAGVLLYSARDCPGRVAALLAAAALVRETGLIFIAACCSLALFKRQYFRTAAYAAAALPAFVWWAYVNAQVTVEVPPHAYNWLFRYPFAGLFLQLFRPEAYTFGPLLTRAVQAADALALAGAIAAVAAAGWSLRRRPFTLESWMAVWFLLLVAGVSTPKFWAQAYNYARPLSPMLLVMALPAVKRHLFWALAPVLMIDVRIAAQLVPQAWGVVRGLI
jgi:hypothetical protein